MSSDEHDKLTYNNLARLLDERGQERAIESVIGVKR